MLSASNLKAVQRARELRGADPGYYARSLAAIQRSGSTRQQAAIEAVIAADGTEALFERSNGCLIAAKGI